MKGRKNKAISDVLWFMVGTCGALFPLVLVVGLSLGADADTWDQVFYRPTYLALRNSLGIFLLQGGLVLPFGLLLGVVAGLFDFPLRKLALGLSLIPLALPTFITAIGVQTLGTTLPWLSTRWTDGFMGCVWTGIIVSFPIVCWGTYLSVRMISQDEKDSVLQVGGKALLWRVMMRRMFPMALVYCGGAGVLGISDFGVSNIMGCHGIATEIQIAFAMRFNFVLSAAKALAFLILLLPLILLGWRTSRGLEVSSHQLLRGGHEPELSFFSGVGWSLVHVLGCVGGGVAMFLGILKPLWRPQSHSHLWDMWSKYLESLEVTLLYGVGGGLLATVIGFLVVSFFYGKSKSKWSTSVMVGIALSFVLPSGVTALGMTWIGSHAPEWLDAFFRSHMVVVHTLGLRFIAIAVLLYSLGFQMLPKDLELGVRLHNLSLWTERITLQGRALWRYTFLSVMVCSVLSLADVGVVTLVQPPSGGSFGSYFFGSMDNTPEVLVSSMCLAYMALPLGLLIIGGSVLWLSTLRRQHRGL